MTFDLTPEQQALADRARAAAASIGDSVANAIDSLGSIAEDISTSLRTQSLTGVFKDGAVNAAIVLEELAAVSASLSAQVGFSSVLAGNDAGGTAPMTLAGLRGSDSVLARVEVADAAAKAKARLAAAAVAIGVGRAAVAHALASMKKAAVKPGPDEYAPHWTFADGATDIAAARVLTYDAAQKLDRDEDAEGSAARAHIFAANAAVRAVDAAIKVEGPWGYAKGGLLERLSRDARTLQVILK